jgi:hypothetical protein
MMMMREGIVSADEEADMDGEEDINDDHIPSNKEGFEFVNVDEDEWIDNLQADADADVDGASSSENELSNSSDEEDIKIMRM